jgi:hypothetical protein
MRCPDARQLLSDGELDPSQEQALQEHLAQCALCRAARQEQRRLESILRSPHAHAGHTAVPQSSSASISTEKIMQAVHKQKRITDQLEHIRQQQQCRIARIRTAGAVGIALVFLILSSIPLLFLAMTFIQTDFTLKVLSFLNGAIDTGIIVGQYMQRGLVIVMSNNWLLSGLAFVVIVMMGMWLRLMRPPQEA